MTLTGELSPIQLIYVHLTDSCRPLGLENPAFAAPLLVEAQRERPVVATVPSSQQRAASISALAIGSLEPSFLS